MEHRSDGNALHECVCALGMRSFTATMRANRNKHVVAFEQAKSIGCRRHCS